MFPRIAALGFLAVLVVTVAVSGQDEDAEVRQDFVLAGDPVADFDVVTGTRIELVPLLYPSVSPHDIQRYARWLVLSNDQESYIWHMYNYYRQAYGLDLRKRVSQIASLAQSVVQMENERQYDTIDYFNVLSSWHQEIDQCNKASESLAQLLIFDEMKRILAPVQLEGFWRVELDHKRRKVANLDWRHAPARADLATMAERMGLDASEYGAIEAVSIEYERRVTPLIVRLVDEMERRKIPLADAWWRVTLDDQGRTLDSSPASQAIFAEKIAAIREILREGAQLQQSIHEINKEYLPRFIDALPPDRGDAFLSMYRAIAYQWIYPDWAYPETMARSIVTSNWQDIIGPEIIEAFTIEWKRFEKEHRRICEQMEAAWDRHYHGRAATEADPEGIEYRAKMRKWREDRWTLDEKFLEKMKSFLPPEMLAVYSEEIRACERKLYSGRLAAEGGGFP